jgi:hypothetical protein
LDSSNTAREAAQVKDRLPAIFAGAVLLFSFYLSLSYFSGILIGGLLSSALLLLVVFTASGCGRILLRLFAVQDLSESEKTLIGTTLGVGLLSQAMLLLGLAGGLKTWAVSLLLGLFWVIGFTEMRDIFKSLGANRSLLRERPLFSAGVLLVLALLLWMTWVPSHLYDSLLYHLALPSEYLRKGRIAPVDHLIFSHFPQNGEMLFTLGLLLGSDTLARMFSWLTTFLSVWWIFEMGKREMPIVAVLLGCLLTVTHTAVMLLTPIAYVESHVMLWVTASVLSFLRWRMSSDIEISQRGWLALSGVFAGLGIGTEYYAAIVPILLGLYLLFQWLRMRPWSQGGSYVRGSFLDGVFFAAGAGIFGAPWLIKNTYFIGNPVFPFFHSIFSHHGILSASEAAATYFNNTASFQNSKSWFLLDVLQVPYSVAAGSSRLGVGADVLGGLGWGLLVVSLPAGLFYLRGNRYLRLVLMYCAGHGLIWFGTGVALRYLSALIPLLSLLAAFGLYRVWQSLSSEGRVVLGTGMGLMIALNGGLFLYVHGLFDSGKTLLGHTSRGEYLSKKLDYYACADYAQGHLGENDKILVVGESRGYYIRQPHVTTSVNVSNPFVQWANTSISAQQYRQTLKAEGFRYMLMVPREAQRLGENKKVFNFTEQGQSHWSSLESKGLERVFNSSGQCGLYKIL